MTDTILFFIVFSVIFFLLNLLTIFMWQLDRNRFDKEKAQIVMRHIDDFKQLREAWLVKEKEWKVREDKLLDRIMAQDLTEYKTISNISEDAANMKTTFLSDKDEKELAERERGDRQ